MADLLIADSGGTGTDWVLIRDGGGREYFSTESYHPSKWKDQFWERISEYWNQRQEVKAGELHFYGAGCLNKETSAQIHSRFTSMGFDSVSVKSDLHAAGASANGSGKGTVAILGTGSVVFEYENGAVDNIIGGLGHKIGDEGSGFYFGKLIIEQYKSGGLSNEQLEILNAAVDLDVLSQLKGDEVKYEWSRISKLVSDHKDVFKSVHLLNMECFVKKHFKMNTPSEISLIGSYAYYNHELWIQVLNEIGCKVGKVIRRPIEHLID